MHSPTFKLQYRPLRIGWCIRANDFAALRESIRRTFTLCGGAQNPLIVIDDSTSAERLISSARVDVLLAVNEDTTISEFKKRIGHLPDWPPYQPFFKEGTRPECTFLDIVSVARCLPARERNLDRGRFANFMLFRWADSDPLADILLTSCGRLPRDKEPGAFVERELTPIISRIEVNLLGENPLPLETLLSPSLRTLCDYGLEYDLWNARTNAPAGFFVGGCNDFWSVVNYWNFRASGWNLLFYDPAHAGRIERSRDAWLQHLTSPDAPQRPGDSLAIVAADESSEHMASWLPREIARYPTEANALTNIPILLLYYRDHNAVSNIGRTQSGVSATMAIPPPPFQLDRRESRNVALVIDAEWSWSQDDQSTFQAPNIPCLNTYYGDKLTFLWNSARAEPHGVALLQRHFSGTLTVTALNVGELFRELFHRLGVVARPSPAGLVTTRVISQMGQLDNCRVFRVRGLRKLIESTRPEKSFTRSQALQAIREELPGGKSGFDRYTDLHIEPPPARRAQPEDILRYMVSHGAFRVGLEFECTECSLTFWTSLDNAKANPQCEYCGKRFDATPQLRDRDWRYRRSGVFGKEDSQLGAIPVALTLLRFLHMDPAGRMLYTPSLTLRGKKGLGINCEIDFIALFPGTVRNTVQVAIAECKSRYEITERDITNLMAVADLLANSGLEVFIVFAKLGQFSPAELALVRRVNAGSHRAIVLTEKELEPWFPYKWAESLSGRPRFGSDLDDFAVASAELYLNGAASN
jgi:hypothetical protein